MESNDVLSANILEPNLLAAHKPIPEQKSPWVYELSKDLIDRCKKELPDSFNDFYSSDKTKKTFGTINSCRTLFSHTSGKDALINLCIATSYGYNAVPYTESKTLSKNNRVNILRTADVLEGITIACVDPSDIASVTLFSKFVVLTDAEEKHGLRASSQHQSIYVPVKTINNPTSNYIKFFDTPLLMCIESFKSLSIEVKFNVTDPYKTTNEINTPVLFHWLFIDSPIRNSILRDSDNYNH